MSRFTLKLEEVELGIGEPPTAFFRIRVIDSHGQVRNVMKQYRDIANFFELAGPQLNIQKLPRRYSSEAALAREPIYRQLVQDAFSALLKRPSVDQDPLFLDFFQVSDVYRQANQVRYSLGAHVQRPQGVGDAGSSAYSIPRTWPRDIASSTAYVSDAQPVAPLAWDSAMPFPMVAPGATSSHAQPPLTSPALAPLSWNTIEQPTEAGISWPTAPATAEESPLSWEGLGASQPEFLLPARSGTSAGSGPMRAAGTPSSLSEGGRNLQPGESDRAESVPVAPPQLPAAVQVPGLDSPGKASSIGSTTSSGQGITSSGPGGSRPWCVICMAKPEEVAVDPCGHLSMCQGCAEKVQACPVCRGPVGKLLRVFVVR